MLLQTQDIRNGPSSELLACSCPLSSHWGTDCVGAVSQTEKNSSLKDARQQQVQAVNERKHKNRALPRHANGKINRHRSHDLASEAGPSELPSRDTSSSDSGRAGQNGARAGPNALQGGTSHCFRRNTAAAESTLNKGSEQVKRRLDRPEEVRGGLDRESSKSGNSSGGRLGPKGNGQRAACPSRLGPGRGNARPEVPVEREPVKNGRKRPLQVVICILEALSRLCL